MSLTATRVIRNPGDVTQYKAAEAIEPNRALKFGTTDATTGQPTVLHCTAIADICIGASMTKTAINEMATVQQGGIALLECSTSVAEQVQVMPTAAAAGKVSLAAGATARSIGVVMPGPGSGGDANVVAVFLNVPNLNGPANS